MTQAGSRRKGFWKLHHGDLQALLQCPGLSWEAARVFLALGDLTWGWGKAKAVISLGRIARSSGLHREHVPRAIDRLRELGLYGEKRLPGRRVVRWILWPGKVERVTDPGNTQTGQGVTKAGNTSVTKAGNKSATGAGDTIKKKNVRPSRKAEADGHQKFVEWFCDEYQRQTGIAYDFQGGKDGAALKALLKKYTVKELQAMATAMLADPWGRENASIALLRGQVNRWRQKAKPAGESQAAQAEKQRLAELQEIVNGD